MTNDRIHETQARLGDWFTGYFDDLNRLGEGFAEDFSHEGGADFVFTEESRAKFNRRVIAYMKSHTVPDGTGVIFDRQALGSSDGVVEWWVRGAGEDEFFRHPFWVTPNSERFYDYERLEWFINGFFEGARSVTGPYIDYLGVEEYVATFTVPFHVGQKRLGVVGLDFTIRDLEKQFIPVLRCIPHDTAIVNVHDNVLVGSSGRFVSGDRVATVPAGYTTSALQPHDIGLRLLHRAED